MVASCPGIKGAGQDNSVSLAAHPQAAKANINHFKGQSDLAMTKEATSALTMQTLVGEFWPSAHSAAIMAPLRFTNFAS